MRPHLGYRDWFRDPSQGGSVPPSLEWLRKQRCLSVEPEGGGWALRAVRRHPPTERKAARDGGQHRGMRRAVRREDTLPGDIFQDSGLSVP